MHAVSPCAGRSGRSARSTTRRRPTAGAASRRHPDPRCLGRGAGRRARGERARARHRAARPRRRAARHRARDRAGAGAHAAGHDDRLRRQPHQHARCLRHARLRHRHDRGRARARDAVPAAAQAALPRGRRSTAAWPRASAPRISCWRSSAGSASTAAPVTSSSIAATAIRALSMEERMTVCNMSIEAGARAGMIAPGRDDLRLPRGAAGVRRGRGLGAGARALARAAGRRRRRFRPPRSTLDARGVEPMISYGTNPGMVVAVGGSIPERGDDAFMKALALHGLRARRRPCAGKPVDMVFIGSCTNSRLSDLRDAAAILQAPQGRAQTCACSSCPARSRSSATRSVRASTRSSPPPAPSGASPAARCASA